AIRSSDNTLKVWSVARGRELLTLSGHRARVSAVAIAPDDSYIASGSDDGTIRIWDSVTGRALRTLRGHAGGITAIAWLFDGEHIVSVAVDGTMYVWRRENGTIVAGFTGESPFLSCAAAPDGMTIIAGDRSGQAHILRLEGFALSAARTRLSPPSSESCHAS